MKRRRKQYMAGGAGKGKAKGAGGGGLVSASGRDLKGWGGVLCSVDGREVREAVGEAVHVFGNLLAPFAATAAAAAPAESPADDGDGGGAQEAEGEMSVEALLKAEMEAARQEGKQEGGTDGKADMRVVRFGDKMGIFLVRLPGNSPVPAVEAATSASAPAEDGDGGAGVDPVQLVKQLFDQMREERAPVSRRIVRMIPVQYYIEADLELVLRTLRPMLDAAFEPQLPAEEEGKGQAEAEEEAEKQEEDDVETEKKETFAIVLRRKCAKSFPKDDCIRRIGEMMSRRPYKVNLETPNHAIIVDVFKMVCGLAVVRDYDKYDQLNLRVAQQPFLDAADSTTTSLHTDRHGEREGQAAGRGNDGNAESSSSSSSRPQKRQRQKEDQDQEEEGEENAAADSVAR